MSAESIEGKVREIIAEQLGISEDDIASSASFTGDLGADTLDFMELIMALEDEFELEFDEEEVENFKTVQDVVDYLSSRV